MRVIKKGITTGTTQVEVTEREKVHAALSRKAASAGMVLLKNEGAILPLDKAKPVALYGSGAYKTIKGGTGSGDVNERSTVSISEGIRGAGYTIANEDWLKEYAGLYDEARGQWIDLMKSRLETETSEALLAFFDFYCANPFQTPSGSLPTEAACDTAVYVLSRNAGEGADRFAAPGDYYLTEAEEEMLAAVCKLYQHVVLIVNAGGIVDMAMVDKYANIQAVLIVSQPGMEAGNAVADVLSGAVAPSGKLTDSWAFNYADYPSSATFSHNDGDVLHEQYTEGIYVGYRYFDTFGVPVRYGFGAGLSYTEFALKTDSIQTVSDGTDAKNGSGLARKIAVEVTVTNTGKTAGKEVVQVYASAPGEKGQDKEFRRLTGFGKTKELQPGESQTLVITFPAEQMASYCMGRKVWYLEDGLYAIWVGDSLESAKVAGGVHVAKEVFTEKDQEICPLPEEEKASLKEAHDKLMATLDTEKLAARRTQAKREATESSCGVAELDLTDWKVREVEYKGNVPTEDEEAKAIAESLTVEQLISLSTGAVGKGQGGALGAAGESVPGSAAQTSNCAREQGVAPIVLADGPAGLRLMKYYDVDDATGNVLQKPFAFSLEGGCLCDDLGISEGQSRHYQYCTAIPVGTLLAQTFDTALVEEVGEMIGKELQMFNVTLWLAPGMNIHRNPLCGRNFEYYSEDPLVAGVMAAAMTKGVQENAGVGTTIKHFACNSQEDSRKFSNSVLCERALREIYLKGFEIAVKSAQPMSIMTSYNEINGVHAANNADLCTKAARDEWGFKGVIMTDWTTTEDGPQCTASGCIHAGNEWTMPGVQADHENIRQALAEGSLTEEELRACASRAIRVILQSVAYEDAQPYNAQFADLPVYVKAESK